MILSLRSFFMGLITIIPNTVPIIMAYGTWYFIHGSVGLSTSIVAMASIGIVVDDTVHFLTSYIRKRKQGSSVKESIEYTISSVGSALFITSLVLACGFAVLMLSIFNLNAHMGILFVLTIVFALACDFLFLPSILLMGSSLKKGKA